MHHEAIVTVDQYIATGSRVEVWCKVCRSKRPVDLAALSAAGKGALVINRTIFRCRDCGTAGAVERYIERPSNYAHYEWHCNQMESDREKYLGKV